MPDRFEEGYWAAQRFYGEVTREALTKIGREVEKLRAEFPKVPWAVDRYLTEIERLAHINSGDAPLTPPIFPGHV